MPRRSDISISYGSSTLDLQLKTANSGLKAWHKHSAPPLHRISSKFEYFPGFGKGAGAFYHNPGMYAVGTNFDGRWGFGMPGPREVADLTGIASGYRVKKIIKHLGINTALTYNGTDTRIYRVETTWVLKATTASTEGTDIVSFNGVLAVAFGSGAAYRYTAETSNGASSWTLTASTKTAGNAERANYFLVQMNGLLAPRVTYVVNPNEIYFTEDLTNTDATGSTWSLIGETGAQNYFTSIAEDDLGMVLFGMRHALFSIDSDGVVYKLTEDYPDPIAEAGGQSDRNNFEAYTKVNGRLYYIIQGYDLLEYYHQQINEYMAPRETGKEIPRMQLPLNCITSAGGWVILFMGSANTATLFDVVHAPGGSALLSNTFSTVSEMWAGRYQIQDGQEVFVWHGAMLVCTDLLRGAFFDEDDNYLYLFSGASEAADAQMRRCIFTTTNPATKLTSSAVNLNTGVWTVETGRIDYGEPQLVKEFRSIEVHTLGLVDDTQDVSLEVEYRKASDYVNTAYNSGFVTYIDDSVAETGTAFTAGETFRTARLKFIGTGDAVNNLYPLMVDAVLTCEDHPTKYDVIDVVAYAVSGKANPTGAQSRVSGKGINNLLDTWKSNKAVATLTDKVSGDTYSVKLENYNLSGLGAKQELSLSMIEAA